MADYELFQVDGLYLLSSYLSVLPEHCASYDQKLFVKEKCKQKTNCLQK